MNISCTLKPFSPSYKPLYFGIQHDHLDEYVDLNIYTFKILWKNTRFDKLNSTIFIENII